MPVTINDGLGRGRQAKITGDQRLAVDAVTHNGEFRANASGKAFAMTTSTTADTLTLTDTGGYMVYIENDSTTDMLIIDHIFVSMSASTNIIRIERNASISSPTNTNTYTPVNRNFSSSQSADGTFYTWNETGNGMTTVTAGTEIFVARLDVGLTDIVIDGMFMLDTDDTLVMFAEGVGSTPEFAANIFFRYLPDSLVNDVKQGP